MRSDTQAAAGGSSEYPGHDTLVPTLPYCTATGTDGVAVAVRACRSDAAADHHALPSPTDVDNLARGKRGERGSSLYSGALRSRPEVRFPSMRP